MSLTYRAFLLVLDLDRKLNYFEDCLLDSILMIMSFKRHVE